MDCKISRHVSEQLSSPTCSAHPSGRGSPRRTWACRLHCAQRMVTSGACSVMAAILLVSAWAPAPCRTAQASGVFSVHGGGHHTIEALKPRTPDNVREDSGCLANGIVELKRGGRKRDIFCEGLSHGTR